MTETELHTIDTHAMVKDLIAAGFTERQAEAHVSTLSRFISYNLATKTDIAKIERDIEGLRKETKTSIEELRKETKSDIEMLRRDLTIRMGAMLSAGIAVIGAGIGILAFVLARFPA